MALSLNGSGHLTSTTGSAPTITLSNMSAGDVIIVDAGFTSAGTLTSLSATGITFDGSRHANNGANDRWRGVANSSGTNVVVTINFNTSNTTVANVYAISGANTSSSFDLGGPQTYSGVPSDGTGKTITTQSQNTMAIGFFIMNSTQNPTADTGNGFVLISGADFYCTEYKILNSAQQLTFTLGTGAGDSRGSILDAVVAAAVAAPPNPSSAIRYLGWYA